MRLERILKETGKGKKIGMETGKKTEAERNRELERKAIRLHYNLCLKTITI